MATSTRISSPEVSISLGHRRLRYPDRFVGRKQELLLGLLVGLVGLLVTALVFANADSVICAIGVWTPECAELAAASIE